MKAGRQWIWDGMRLAPMKGFLDGAKGKGRIILPAGGHLASRRKAAIGLLKNALMLWS
jgi:hypothetical protein